jgi:hypothetical protein
MNATALCLLLMIFTVQLQPGTLLSNVAYSWIAAGLNFSKLKAHPTNEAKN